MAAHQSQLAVGNVPGTDGFQISAPTGRRVRPLWLRCANRGGAVAYLNLYDAALADVTPGTDRIAPSPIPVTNGETVVIPLDHDHRFSTLSILASTASDGTGASPGTPLEVQCAYESVG